MKLLDVIALIESSPEKGLCQGQVETIVEVYEPRIFDAEFSDMQGRTYALETLRNEQLIVLHYQPIAESILLQN